MENQMKTLEDYNDELLTKAHGLHIRLSFLAKVARPLIEAMPPGDARSFAAFQLTQAEAALEEHKP